MIICTKLTSLVVLLQAIGCAVSISTRGASSNEGPTLSLRKLRECNDTKKNMKVMIDYGNDPEPEIRYGIYDINGTEIDWVEEYLEPTPNEDEFFERNYCLDSPGCYTLIIDELGRRGILGTKYDHYIIELESNGKKIVDGKTSRKQYFKIGNCISYVCDQGEGMLHIQMDGYVDDSPDSPIFDYAIYNGSGALIEAQQEGYASNIKGPHYFETSLCLNPSDCYTVWIAKDAAYQVDFNETLVATGVSGRETSVFKIGGGDCPVCNSKPLLVDSSTYQRAHDIMSVITTISGMEAFLDTDTPHYQAACWMIYDDHYQVTAADNSLVQRYILALLFFSTNGWDWTRKRSFLSPISECNWNNIQMYWNGTHWIKQLMGVTCNENGNVNKIVFALNKLEGYLLSELSKLMDLEVLYLPYNILQGTIPNEFAQMKQMRKLRLERNTLTGTIPQGLLENKNLEILHLNSNILHGTLPSSTISNATSLVKLQLHSNLLSGTIPEDIEKTALIWLDLSHNNIYRTIPMQLSNLTHAREIQLSNNSLSGTIPTELGYLSSLSFLDLSYNSLYGELPTSFINLFSLKKLYIHNNNMSGHVSGEFCTHLMNSTMGYSFEADCGDQQIEGMMDCSCCTECYSHFSFLDHFGECNGVELKVEINDEKSTEIGQYWSLKDSLGRLVLKDGPYLANLLPKSTYISCVATTGCYSMHATERLEFEIFGNNASIIYHHFTSDEVKVNFGYSSTSNSLQVDRCDDITIYGEIAPQNTTRRNIFDSFVRISGLDLLNTSEFTPQYKSAEWLLNESDNFKDPMDPRIIQRYILGILYFSTNGQFWLNNKSWINEIHECTWYGITCYNNETVIGIELPQNNLNGFVPFEIGELSNLQNLRLPNNSLNESIPIEIVNLYSLETLDLGNNTLSGMIPTMLQTLKKLKVLNLQNNHISGMIPSEIWHLDKLTSIHLSNNTLTGSLPVEIYDLLRLKRLDLSKNFLHGSIDEIKFNSLSGLTHLDLSINSFTGTVPNSISKFEKLQMLNIAQNSFKGSIPSSIGDLVELQTLLLHDNELTGRVPTEIGRLEKIVNISLSYNLLRGTIPNEFKNLGNLKLLLLHQNQLVGESNLFQKNQPNKFVTDCGSILDSPAAVTCPYCTECCNSEGHCLTVSKTWPKILKSGMFEGMNGKAGLQVIIILTLVFIGFFAIAFGIMKVLKASGKILPELETPVKDSFAEQSVYRFLLSNNIFGWFLALFTVVMQALIFYVFLNASDFTSDSNEWEYSVDCPKDSLDCEDTRTRNKYGWFMALFIIIAFLLKDLANASMLIYESIAGSNIQSLFASLTLMFVTVLAIISSLVINYATGMSNAQILKDSALLLFLSDIDEALYSAIQVISPGWIDRLEFDSNRSHNTSSRNEDFSATSRNMQQDLSVLRTDHENLKIDFDIDYRNIKNELRMAKDERSVMELEIKELYAQLDEFRRNFEKK